MAIVVDGNLLRFDGQTVPLHQISSVEVRHWREREDNSWKIWLGAILLVILLGFVVSVYLFYSVWKARKQPAADLYALILRTGGEVKAPTSTRRDEIDHQRSMIELALQQR